VCSTLAGGRVGERMKRTVVVLTAAALIGLSGFGATGSVAATPGHSTPVASRDGAPQGAALTDLRAVNGRLVDGQGRDVVLRGINVVDKQGWTGTMAAPMLTREMVAQLADMGFNHLRFGTTWASIQHDRDAYDEAYIDQFIDQLDVLDSYGLGAVIDMHQDVWSGQLGSTARRHGRIRSATFRPTPTWRRRRGSGWPSTPRRRSTLRGRTSTTTATAPRTCTAPERSRRSSSQMWGRLASRLADHPAVIGYDLLNEPWPTGPPGLFEQVYLMPMYERVAAAIREHDATTPIFFGPPLYSPAVPTVAVEPAGPQRGVRPAHLHRDDVQRRRVSTGARSDEVVLIKDREDAEQMGVPLWIGEWGRSTTCDLPQSDVRPVRPAPRRRGVLGGPAVPGSRLAERPRGSPRPPVPAGLPR
jgi:endoglycosylceramidase